MGVKSLYNYTLNAGKHHTPPFRPSAPPLPCSSAPPLPCSLRPAPCHSPLTASAGATAAATRAG